MEVLTKNALRKAHRNFQSVCDTFGMSPKEIRQKFIHYMIKTHGHMCSRYIVWAFGVYPSTAANDMEECPLEMHQVGGGAQHRYVLSKAD